MFNNFLGIGLILVAHFVCDGHGREYPKNMAIFPFAVSVTITANGAVTRECTGAIVSEQHVLTSMRCIYVSGTPIVSGFVRAGADIINSDGEIHPIKKLFPHPKYEENDYRDNVALVLVYNFFDFTTFINEIPMNWDFLYQPGLVSVIGFMGNGVNDHNRIYKFDSSTISLRDCQAAYGNFAKSGLIRQETLCVARAKNIKICSMSPGTLLLRYNKLIAVLTYQLDNCSGQDNPILFTLVSHYTSMMSKIIDPQIFGKPK